MRPGRGFLAAELRYRGARDGRRVGSQAAADRADHNYARGVLRTLFYGFESAATNDILLYAIAGVPSAWAARYQLTNSSHPARGESFVSLLCSTLAIPHHFFSLSLPNSRRNEPGITPPFFRHSPALKNARPTVFGSPPFCLPPCHSHGQGIRVGAWTDGESPSRGQSVGSFARMQSRTTKVSLTLFSFSSYGERERERAR